MTLPGCIPSSSVRPIQYSWTHGKCLAVPSEIVGLFPSRLFPSQLPCHYLRFPKFRYAFPVIKSRLGYCYCCFLYRGFKCHRNSVSSISHTFWSEGLRDPVPNSVTRAFHCQISLHDINDYMDNPTKSTVMLVLPYGTPNHGLCTEANHSRQLTLFLISYSSLAPLQKTALRTSRRNPGYCIVESLWPSWM